METPRSVPLAVFPRHPDLPVFGVGDYRYSPIVHTFPTHFGKRVSRTEVVDGLADEVADDRADGDHGHLM